MSTCRIGTLAHHTACLGRSCTGPLSNVTSPLSGHARPGLRILHPRPPATHGRQQCVGSCRCLIRDSDAADLIQAYLPHEFRSCLFLRRVACTCAERRGWLPLHACMAMLLPLLSRPHVEGLTVCISGTLASSRACNSQPCRAQSPNTVGTCPQVSMMVDQHRLWRAAPPPPSPSPPPPPPPRHATTP